MSGAWRRVVPQGDTRQSEKRETVASALRRLAGDVLRPIIEDWSEDGEDVFPPAVMLACDELRKVADEASQMLVVTQDPGQAAGADRPAAGAAGGAGGVDQEGGMKVVYVAGPYRGANAWEIERNIRRAEEEAFKVWEMGAAAVCPHANTRYFQGTLPDQVWLDGDLAILRLCDAVYVVPNWEASTGTKIEIEQAKRWDIPVFYDIDALDEWLQLELEAS